MTLEAKRKLTCILFAAAYFLYGTATEFGRTFHWPNYYDLTFVLIALLLIASWYYFDAKIVQYTRTKLMNVLVVGLALIGIPIYLFSTRGSRKGLIGTGLFLTFLIITYILVYLGEWFGYCILRLTVHNHT